MRLAGKTGGVLAFVGFTEGANMENGQVSEAVAKATREALDQFHLPGKHKQKEHEKRLHPKARAMLKRFKKMSKSDVRRGDEIRRLRAQMRRDAAKEGVFLLE